MTQNTKRDSMIFYRSIFEAALELPPKKRDAAIMAILEYGFNDKEPDSLHPMENILFTVAKPLIDMGNKRYETAINNGKKGGRPRKQASCNTSAGAENKNQWVFENENQSVICKKNLNDNVNDNDNDNVNVNVHDNVNVNDNEKEETAEAENTRTYGYGEYQNIFLTKTETERLIDTLGKDKYDKSIRFFSGYLARRPDHKSSCHYEDLRGWVQNALVDRGIVPSKEDEEKAEHLKKTGFDIEFEDIYEKP